jgi:hypothetical protein
MTEDLETAMEYSAFHGWQKTPKELAGFHPAENRVEAR